MQLKVLLITILILAGCTPQAGTLGEAELSQSLNDVLRTKTATERKDIKGTEYEKIGSIRKTQVGDYEIQVVDINKIQNGIEVFARVWGKNGQIGFGKDGTIDIERFIIINPPVLIEDPTGDIVIDYSNEYETVIVRYREDLSATLLLILGQIIDNKQNKSDSKNIIQGKIGRTTLQVFSDAGTGNTTVDGEASRHGVDEIFSTLRGGTGTQSDDTSTVASAELLASATTNQYQKMSRGFLTFDTSSIPDDATIDSALISFITSKRNFLGLPDLHIAEATPTSDNAIVDGDFTQIQRTSFASLANADVGGRDDLTLNASGEATIDKTGISQFSTQLSWDINNDTTGLTWVDQENSYIRFFTADQTGTTNDPYLIVEYTAIEDTNPTTDVHIKSGNIQIKSGNHTIK